MADDASQLPQSRQVVEIEIDDRESQTRHNQSNRDSNLSRKSNAGTQAPRPVSDELETAGLQEACVPDEKSLVLNIKTEPDSQLNATLHSPSQNTYLSGTYQSPKSDLFGTKESPKKTYVVKPDKSRAKKRDRTVQKL